MHLPNSALKSAPSLQTPKSARSFLPKIRFKEYLALTKPTIISLLLVTTFVPMYLAGDGPPSLSLVLWTLLGGFLAAGGANTLNQYVDRDIDHVMERTAKRPLPSGKLTPVQVLLFGMGMSVLSFVQLWLTVNLLTAVLAVSGILFYLFVYTLGLKRTSTQNIVIGGAAGAVPPLVGWAAVANEITLLPIFMFLIVFYWTPPHFWAIALMRQKEYREAKVPMLPVIVGEKETKTQIILYSVLLLLICIIPVFLGLLGPIYLAVALILNGVILRQSITLWHATEAGSARPIFLFSMMYLALLFLAMGIDGLFFDMAKPFTFG